MKKKTINYKSRSSDNCYQTRRDSKGMVTCTGYEYQGKCWHSEKVTTMIIN